MSVRRVCLSYGTMKKVISLPPTEQSSSDVDIIKVKFCEIALREKLVSDSNVTNILLFIQDPDFGMIRLSEYDKVDDKATICISMPSLPVSVECASSATVPGSPCSTPKTASGSLNTVFSPGAVNCALTTTASLGPSSSTPTNASAGSSNTVFSPGAVNCALTTTAILGSSSSTTTIASAGSSNTVLSPVVAENNSSSQMLPVEQLDSNAPTPSTGLNVSDKENGMSVEEAKALICIPELSETLSFAHSNGILCERENEFIRFMAKHLTSIIPEPSKPIYDHYCKLLVNKYKEFADPDFISGVAWGTLKYKLRRTITNSKYHKSNSEEKKAERLKRKLPDGKNCLEEQLRPTADGEADSEESFVSRRTAYEMIMLKEYTGKKRTRKSFVAPRVVVQDIAAYSSFETVFADFCEMDPMKKMDRDRFIANIKALFAAFRSFMKDKQEDFSIDCDDSELLSLLNENSSTLRGVKYFKLFTLYQVGTEVSIEQAAENSSPHMYLYTGEKGAIESMLIVANGESLTYIIQVKSLYEAILNLLAVYYVFHLDYPAAYGALDVIDKYCLSCTETLDNTKDAARHSIKGSRTPKKTTLQKFYAQFSNRNK